MHGNVKQQQKAERAGHGAAAQSQCCSRSSSWRSCVNVISSTACDVCADLQPSGVVWAATALDG